MSFTVDALFRAIEGNDERQLWAMLQKMTLDEAVSAGTALGPQRLRSLLLHFVGQTRFPGFRSTWLMTPVTLDLEAVIPMLLSEAFRDQSFLVLPRDIQLQSSVRSILRKVHADRAARAQIVLHRDVTHTLLPPQSCPAPLSDAQYAAAAARHGVDVAAIKAVAEVESGGRSGFDDRHRAKILFEAHHFRKHTQQLYDLTHPHLSCPRVLSKKYYSWNQYDRLYEAMVLDPIAAVKACSWGKFQVLGSNHNGWPEPLSFARAMQRSEENHLKSFESYCTENNLMAHVKSKNWARFAAGYNGANYQEFNYDTKIATAYAKYGGK